MALSKNIAVVGCGYWGQNIVRSAADLGVLAAVSDADPARAQGFAEKYGVPALSYDDILANKDIAGVCLPVPAPLHAPMTLRALEAGKHVMVEKPIAMSLDEAETMVAAADKASRILMVGHVLHYHPVFIALQAMVREGKLGQLRHIYSNRLNFGKVRTEENVFWSFAPHDVSMVLALAGREPVSVSAVYSNGIEANRVASTANVQFDFGAGLNGHIFVSWLNPFKEQKLVVVGDAGMCVFDDTLGWDKKLAFYKASVTFEGGQPVLAKAEPEYIAVGEGQPLRNEIEHFAQCMASGETPRTDGREGLRTLKVMQACDKMAGL